MGNRLTWLRPSTNTSADGPKFEKLDTASLPSSDPTPQLHGEAAGYKGALVASLPAAHTNTVRGSSRSRSVHNRSNALSGRSRRVWHPACMVMMRGLSADWV